MPRMLSLLLVAVFTLVLSAPAALAQVTSKNAIVQRDLQRATIGNATFLEGRSDGCYTSVYLFASQGTVKLTGPPNSSGALYLSVDDFDCVTGTYRGTSFIIENLTQRDFATQFPNAAHLTTTATSYEGLYTADIDVTWEGQGMVPPPLSDYTCRTVAHSGSYLNVYSQRGREAPASATGTIVVRPRFGDEGTWLNRNVAVGDTTASLLSLQYMNFLVWLPHAD